MKAHSGGAEGYEGHCHRNRGRSSAVSALSWWSSGSGYCGFESTSSHGEGLSFPLLFFSFSVLPSQPVCRPTALAVVTFTHLK